MSVLLRQPRGFEGFVACREPHHPNNLPVADRPDPGVAWPLDIYSTGPAPSSARHDGDDLITGVDQLLKVVHAAGYLSARKALEAVGLSEQDAHADS